MARGTFRPRTWIVLIGLAPALGMTPQPAVADVVTFVRTGSITEVVQGNVLGLEVGDPVLLALTFDRELVLGPTPTRSTLPVFQGARLERGGLEIRLEVAGLVLTERDDEEFRSSRPEQPGISLGPDGPSEVRYSPVFSANGGDFRVDVSVDRLFVVDTTDVSADEQVAAIAVLDEQIDPPPFPMPALRDGPFVLLDDQRRLEHLCRDVETDFDLPPPPLVVPFVPFGAFSRSGFDCLGSAQHSTVAPTHLQGSGLAEARPVPDDNLFPRGGFSFGRSVYDVSFRLEADAVFDLSGMLTTLCEAEINSFQPIVVEALTTPFVVLERADGSEVFRRSVLDVADPEAFADPDIEEFANLSGAFSAAGTLPPGDYRIEVVADSDPRAARCEMSSRDTWTFELVLSEPAPDVDGDGVPDEDDNCPRVANADQIDSGGLRGAPADGIGDACQCGDVTGDGRVTVLDVLRLLGVPSRPPALLPAATCDVDGDGRCGPADARAVLRALARRRPLEQLCSAAP